MVTSDYKLDFNIGIDYSRPEKHLKHGLKTTLNDRNLDFIKSELGDLSKDLSSIKQLYEWIRAKFELKAAGGKTIGTSSTNEIIDNGVIGGCHDFGLLISSILRYNDIPCIMVDTASISWATGKSRFAGHVFLEVYINDKWILLDSVQQFMVDEYDKDNPIIPIALKENIEGYFVMLKGIDTHDYGINSLNDLKAHMIKCADFLKKNINNLNYSRSTVLSFDEYIGLKS